MSENSNCKVGSSSLAKLRRDRNERINKDQESKERARMILSASKTTFISNLNYNSQDSNENDNSYNIKVQVNEVNTFEMTEA